MVWGARDFIGREALGAYIGLNEEMGVLVEFVLGGFCKGGGGFLGSLLNK